MKLVQSITFKDKIIPLNNKNFIIIGNNGSGKTYILDNIYSEIKKTVSDTDYIKKNLRLKRERIIDELSISFNNFSNVLELNNKDEKIFLDLRENIDTYSVYDFSSKLNTLKTTISEKHNTFLKNHKKYLESQITDTYTEFNPKSEFKNSLKKEYYYKNSNHLNFYIKDLKKQIGKFSDSSVSIQISNNFNKNNDNLVVNFFNAKRSETSEKNQKLDEISIYSNLDNLFEEYLISQFNSKSPTKKFISDEEFEYVDINNNWLNKVESDLKYIFEEENTKISFDKFQKKIIIASGEKHFNFNNLSSGLQAIFKIYSSLLMRTKIIDIDPTELFGIVLIDEIDVHLHISLQKKIMPFLTNAFPNIQFIVSTHSPFVITSTPDTIVYDISTGDFFEDDLSRYSYESVIKGLFHVDIQSEQLASEIKAIAEILNNEPNNYEKLREIIRNITPYAKQLDVESKSFYFKALNYLLDNQELGDLDV